MHALDCDEHDGWQTVDGGRAIDSMVVNGYRAQPRTMNQEQSPAQGARTVKISAYDDDDDNDVHAVTR